jgi:hypothetical protein
MDKVDMPLNASERYMYAMVVRLDAICNMLSSIVEYIAKKEDVAVENAVEEVKTTSRKKKVK